MSDTKKGNGKVPPGLITFVLSNGHRYQYWCDDPRLSDKVAAICYAPLDLLSIVLEGTHNLLEETGEGKTTKLVGKLVKSVNLVGRHVAAVELVDLFQTIPLTIPQLGSVKFCAVRPLAYPDKHSDQLTGE